MTALLVDAPTSALAAVVSNDGNSIPPWLFVCGVAIVIVIAAVRIIRRKR